jgi:hypothetical protein
MVPRANIETERRKSKDSKMPLQNRVTPQGELLEGPRNAGFMGNRGRFHNSKQQLEKKRWSNPHWLICEMSFNGRKRDIWSDSYTELFFLDEPVALAAGHRPCFECRRSAFRAFAAAWQKAHGGDVPRAMEIDKQLHAARIDSQTRRQRCHTASLDQLPNGAFIKLHNINEATLVWGHELYPFTLDGYRSPVPRPNAIEVEVLTPKPTVAVLKAGYEPAIAISDPLESRLR